MTGAALGALRPDLRERITTQDREAELDPVAQIHLATMRARLLDVAGIHAMKPPEPLIDDVLFRNTLAVLFGKPGHGKSFIALDWAGCIAAGIGWHGHATYPGRVLYIVAEGAAGLTWRIEAWQDRHRTVSLDALRFLPMAVDLLDTPWADATVELVKGYDPVLVIIDTLSRTMPGGNENAPDVMSRWVHNADRIRIATDATVVVVHHQPRDGSSPRGHTSLEGAADTILHAEKAGHHVALTCAKSKDTDELAPVRLALEPRLHSATLTAIEGVAVTADDPESERLLLDALWQHVGTEGATTNELLRLVDMPVRTYYRAKKALVIKGAVLNIGTDKRPRWVTKEPKETE